MTRRLISPVIILLTCAINYANRMSWAFFLDKFKTARVKITSGNAGTASSPADISCSCFCYGSSCCSCCFSGLAAGILARVSNTIPQIPTANFFVLNNSNTYTHRALARRNERNETRSFPSEKSFRSRYTRKFAQQNGRDVSCVCA